MKTVSSFRAVLLVPLILVGLWLLTLLLSSFYTIETGTVGLVNHWGKLDEAMVLEPGLHVKMPLRDSVMLFDTRVQKEEATASAATKDMQDVTVRVAVTYRINRDKTMDLYKKLGSGSLVRDSVLYPAVQETVKAATAKFTAEELLQKREMVKTIIDQQLSQRMADYWLTLDNVSIVNFEFSAEFNKAVELKQVAEQKAKQADYEVAQARAEAEKYKLQNQSLNEYVLRKMFIEKWDGKLPQVTDNQTLVQLGLVK